MFAGDSNLSSTYSFGTFVENPLASDEDFYRPFAADSYEILFITGNGRYFARGKYAEVLQRVNAREEDFGPNIDFTHRLGRGRLCNALQHSVPRLVTGGPLDLPGGRPHTAPHHLGRGCF